MAVAVAVGRVCRCGGEASKCAQAWQSRQVGGPCWPPSWAVAACGQWHAVRPVMDGAPVPEVRPVCKSSKHGPALVTN